MLNAQCSMHNAQRWALGILHWAFVYVVPRRPLNFSVLTTRYATASTIQIPMMAASSPRPIGGAPAAPTCSHTSRTRAPLVHANGVPYSLRTTFSQSNSVLANVLERPRSDGSHLGTRRQ